MTDRNEALRLADELDHLDYDDSRRVAAFLREQAVARAMDTFGHNVMAGRAQLQMVRLESRLQSLTSERDQLRAEVELYREFFDADQLVSKIMDEVSPGLTSPKGQEWSDRVDAAIARRCAAVNAIAARTTHKETE